MTRYFLLPLFLFLGLSIHACSGGSYLSGRLPEEIVFRKQSSGGVVERIGGELNAPGFTLLANGKIIYYDYVGGKRTLVWTKLNRREFTAFYERLSSVWEKFQRNKPSHVTGDDILPVSSLIFHSDSVTYKGASFSDTLSAEYHAAAFGQWVDAFRAGSSKTYTAGTIRLYAKSISQGDVTQTPLWPVREIALDTIVRVPVGFYEPNVDENSVLISGRTAVKLQRMIPQSGIYQRFSFRNKIYVVGYRPVVP